LLDMYTGWWSQVIRTEFWWVNRLEDGHLDDHEGDGISFTIYCLNRLWGWEFDSVGSCPVAILVVFKLRLPLPED